MTNEPAPLNDEVSAAESRLWRGMDTSEDASARRCVAASALASPEVLARMAKDRDQYVRWEVANNPHTQLEVLALLAKDESTLVRRAVADHPRTQPEAFDVDDDDVYLFHTDSDLAKLEEESDSLHM